MKKRLFILLLLLISLVFLSSCAKNEPIVKYDENTGLYLTFGFKPMDSGAQIISTVVNSSEHEIKDLKVTYGIKDSDHTIEESTDAVSSKTTKDLSKVTQNAVHSLDEDKLYTSKIEYTVTDDKKTQRIVYNAIDKSYSFQ